MRNLIKDGSSTGFIKANIFGVLTGLAVMLATTALGAVVMSAADLSSSTAKAIAVIILIISSLVCGMVTAKKAESKSLITGAASGIFLYLIIAVISAAVAKNGFSSAFIIRLIISVVAAAVGALIITLKSNNKKYV